MDVTVVKKETAKFCNIKIADVFKIVDDNRYFMKTEEVVASDGPFARGNCVEVVSGIYCWCDLDADVIHVDAKMVVRE